jgi:preprotein translocase subunit SecG
MISGQSPGPPGETSRPQPGQVVVSGRESPYIELDPKNYGAAFGMIILLFIVHILIAVSLVGVVLLQKSEGGALGMGGGGMSGFMTGRTTANLLTRTTAILAAAFFVTSILLVILSSPVKGPRDFLGGGAAPIGPAPTAPGAPAAPAAPAAPQTPPAAPSAPLR